MDYFFGFILTLLLFLFVAGLAYLIFDSLRASYFFAFGDFHNRHLLIYPLKKEFKTILEQDIDYYKKLSPKNKKVFERRLQKFIRCKHFEAKGDLKNVTNEMVTLIGAAAIQMTFGLPQIYFRHFNRILIYPHAYQSTITNHYHKGEVNTKGLIVLSWDNFLKGNSNQSDGINLGFHELAHALRIQDFLGKGYGNFLDNSLLRRFVSLTRLETRNILNGQDSFFRKYAATNDYEFFAVVVENFFERPHELKAANQSIYYLTSRLLNQDPINSLRPSF